MDLTSSASGEAEVSVLSLAGESQDLNPPAQGHFMEPGSESAPSEHLAEQLSMMILAEAPVDSPWPSVHNEINLFD